MTVSSPETRERRQHHSGARAPHPPLAERPRGSEPAVTSVTSVGIRLLRRELYAPDRKGMKCFCWIKSIVDFLKPRRAELILAGSVHSDGVCPAPQCTP
ncbi:hypothetical protein EYF80_054952 [Liparis tanakae]|uniref:Uncharacterized protein n=1 Tax=Liparis tanakae TaxID=230148 RepID=A0A4Z2F162_9TELE|nr:hypothetical protein EYF80_054952 [Liparis tanakae]